MNASSWSPDDYTGASSRTIRRRRPAQDDATTGWPSLGWIIMKLGPWKVSWKDLLEPCPIREPILKLLLLCGCRFADQ